MGTCRNGPSRPLPHLAKNLADSPCCPCATGTFQRKQLAIALNVAAYENRTSNRGPWLLLPNSMRKLPLIFSTNDFTIRIPNPLDAVGSNPSGNGGPSFETDRTYPPSGQFSKRTAIRPAPYLAALVIDVPPRTALVHWESLFWLCP